MIDKSKARKLHDWTATGWQQGEAVAPVVGCFLSGLLDMWKGRPGRTRVYTSEVVETCGRYVRTESGSIYQLGEPHREYPGWCARRGVTLDEAQPIAVRS